MPGRAWTGEGLPIARPAPMLWVSPRGSGGGASVWVPQRCCSHDTPCCDTSDRECGERVSCALEIVRG